MKGHFDEKDIKYVFMCKDEHKGLDENTPAAMLWTGEVMKISQLYTVRTVVNPDFFVSVERYRSLDENDYWSEFGMIVRNIVIVIDSSLITKLMWSNIFNLLFKHAFF